MRSNPLKTGELINFYIVILYIKDKQYLMKQHVENVFFQKKIIYDNGSDDTINIIAVVYYKDI